MSVENKIRLHSLRNRSEKLTKGSFSTCFQSSYTNTFYTENNNVHILCMIWHRFQYYPTQLFSDKPKTPTIVFSKYPFVGDQIELTCTSQVQRWPVGLSSSLAYTFSVDGAQQLNTLKINVTDSDKGKQVYCTAMDDRRDVSNVSNVITLDPYCEYS